MRDNLGGAVWRLVIFVAVCLTGTVALIAVFGQLRFDSGDSYNAVFSNITGLRGGNFVRIAGVEVGKVEKVSVNADMTVNVRFKVNDPVVLAEDSRAVIRYDNLIGGRYLAIEDSTGSPKRLQPGQTIPLNRTAPALDLDALIGGFRPLFQALDPAQVNALSSQLIQVLQGEGGTIGSFLSQTAALTNTLANRDQLVGEVIVNLNTVLGSLGDQSTQFAKAVDSLSTLVGTLADRRVDISNAIAHGNAASATLADLLSQVRPPSKKVVTELDRTAGNVVADHDYLDDLLNTLPDAYAALGRQGLYGDFFSFYLCDVILKMNGKGGQPVYVKVAGQASGRCTPR